MKPPLAEQYSWEGVTHMWKRQGRLAVENENTGLYIVNSLHPQRRGQEFGGQLLLLPLLQLE